MVTSSTFNTAFESVAMDFLFCAASMIWHVSMSKATLLVSLMSMSHRCIMCQGTRGTMSLKPLIVQGKDRLKPLARVAEGLIVQALSIDSFNPLALHLHIHIAEASSTQRYALLPALYRCNERF